jgi:hypothetical protein
MRPANSDPGRMGSEPGSARAVRTVDAEFRDEELWSNELDAAPGRSPSEYHQLEG